MNKQYLVNIMLPNKGDKMMAADYRKGLIALGYTFHQCIGSIGGSVRAGIISINSGQLVRN